MLRRKTARLALAGALAGTIAIAGASAASAATHWSGNYSTLKACEAARTAHADYGQSSTPCYKSYERNGSVTYYFYWFS